MTIKLRDDIACFYEGSTEKAILDLLIDDNRLIFSREDLVDESFLPLQDLKKGKIHVFSERVLSQVDEQDKMDILIVQDRVIVPDFSSLYREKVGEIIILQTKPEIEMLLIHHHGLYHEFQKAKSTQNPKHFLAQRLKLKEKQLTSYKEIQKRYTAEMFERAIREHARVSNTDRGARQLAEILR